MIRFTLAIVIWVILANSCEPNSSPFINYVGYCINHGSC